MSIWLFTGIDFEHTSGRLAFESGESHKTISIPLIGTPNIGTFTLCLKAIDEHGGTQVSCSSFPQLCALQRQRSTQRSTPPPHVLQDDLRVHADISPPGHVQHRNRVR